MSDKPMLAEIVRADQIKVGDRIVWCDESLRVKTIERGEYYGNGERIQFNALDVDNLLIKPSARVARILPEPVEARELTAVLAGMDRVRRADRAGRAD